MVYIDWEDRYRIGHEAIDNQHRRFFELINNLQQQASAGSGRDATILAMNSLANYALEHFADEEELMDQISFPGLIQHRRRHYSFASKVADMALEWGKGNETSIDDILLFLKEWLLGHILTEDMQIGEALKSRQKTTV
ncbi:MAG: bacteriohemerythrin [candidate division Zixibacteria bacterium]|nr:bacteriohemerythrin [candidate division Zixibacteria bacterium]